MYFRFGAILLLVALATVVESKSLVLDGASWDTVAHLDLGPLHSRGNGVCHGRVGDCIDEDEEMMVDSEATRRVLRGRRYISYGALQRNNVPCNRRGQSYYNCNSRGKANPYRRGCNVITKCARTYR
ncbi:hypothetical protein RJ640_030082 [Escallonia rubra]|uniref:Rapid alkalinization factor n=1 Tax=Escallonia rubra TaxID=112253 RepID=A0AA88QVG7_9ASTE|nr:hypothetical protein RJ640_030082 [Escallonia rubra]